MDAILLHGIKTHNLKNFNLTLPHGKLYVITGVSGSGKSSLAFDTLYAEGQRRYVESLSSYARQFLERMEKPDVESVSGIPPAIAIEAKNVISNARSTVGTQTEINDYLRILFARVGRILCPDCLIEVRKSDPVDIADFLISKYSGKKPVIFFNIPLDGKGKTYFQEALKELERQGFVDYLVRDKIISAEEMQKQKNIPSCLAVCTDSVAVEPKNTKRLVDSLELAYRYGRGEVGIFCENQTHLFSQDLKCSKCQRGFRTPSPNLFSFNSPLGACDQCQGFGRVITIDWDLVIPDAKKTIAEGVIEPWTKPSAEWEWKQLKKFCQKKKIPMNKPWNQMSAKHRDWVLNGISGDDYFSVQDFYDYLEKKTYKMHVRIFLSKYRNYIPCPGCCESRLKSDALAVKINGKNIYEVQNLNIQELYLFLDSLSLSPAQMERVEPVFIEIKNRVRFLKEVGLGYLSLARLSRTLSGGEVQRIHLATSLGSALVDTLYVLDEPSIGLHERDNVLLIRLLKELRDLGNTVVVVEHDSTMIEAADEVIDLGPQGGDKGGELLFYGPIADLKKSDKSLTGQYLAGKRTIVRNFDSAPKAVGGKKPAKIKIKGATEHNLKGIDVEIPLREMVVVTGVSGSGKSTLIYDILYKHYLRYCGRPVQDLGHVEGVTGFEAIDEMILVDQSPIGRSPRSNPVTYIKAYDDIRKIFASTRQAGQEGLQASAFSFNVDGGRCDACKGSGQVKVEMHFLADVYMTCEACHGKRFKPEVLEIHYQGKNIDDVLGMTVQEAVTFFQESKTLYEKLQVLTDVGLGYLRLGQSSLTLSGGEAQRLKLSLEMVNRTAKHILYLFDEPTTGLHYHDIDYLMRAFEELLRRGHSLVIIEHNMEIIRAADSIIDLGPEGGSDGGQILYQGPLNGILEIKASHTGRYVKKYRNSSKISAGTPV